MLMPVPRTANGPALCRQRALVRGRIDAASAAADHRDPKISELIGQLARDFDAVMGRHSRADQRNRVFVLRLSARPLRRARLAGS